MIWKPKWQKVWKTKSVEAFKTEKVADWKIEKVQDWKIEKKQDWVTEKVKIRVHSTVVQYFDDEFITGSRLEDRESSRMASREET